MQIPLQHLIKKIRHVRTLGEIISDVDIETIDVRKKKTCTTPLRLYIKDQEREGKDKLKRQFAALEDTQKLFWIQMALKANEEDDIEKILIEDQQSIVKGEPKKPLNAFNLFIKKKCAEGKIDFKEATETYRKLGKEEKDVYIKMSSKSKMQYKNDLATYLFSLSREEQQNYLSKVETQNPKRTRTVKKIEKPDDEDEIDADAESEHIEQINQIELVEQNEEYEHLAEFENVQIGDIIDMNGYGVCSEQVDVENMKMEEGFGETIYNSASITQPTQPDPECLTTDSSTIPTSTSESKLIDENSKETLTESKSIDENSQSNTRDSSENDKESPLSPRA